MPKSLEIPFYIGEGRRCAQAALRSILDYKGVKKTYHELDLLVGSNSENSVSMFQIANSLHNLDFKFYYPVRQVFQDSSFEDVIKRIKIDYCERIAKLFDIDLLKKSFDTIKSRKLFEVREQRPSLEELVRFIEQKRIVLCMISYDKMIGRGKSKLRQNGHYMVVTSIGNSFVYLHDSGPQGAMPNRPIKVDRFLESWDFSFLDWDVLVV